MSRSKDADRVRISGLLGVGLDGDDGHRRITKGDDFVLVGGSSETHERMQDTMIRFGEALERRGKTLQEAEPAEVVDLLRESQE